MDDYFAAKMRLFTDVVSDGGSAVIWADDAWSERAMAAARARSLCVFSVGEAGEAIRLVSRKPGQLGQELEIEHQGRRYKVMLPLIGAYQAANALTAAGLVLATGGERVWSVRVVDVDRRPGTGDHGPFEPPAPNTVISRPETCGRSAAIAAASASGVCA